MKACESQMWTGPREGEKCTWRARWYSPKNDIFVCGVHARAYIDLQRVKEKQRG